MGVDDFRPRHLLFLDGIGGQPDGFKPRFLARLGYRTTAPALPDLDFARSVAIADAVVAADPPAAIVGYSRGASVAMALNDRALPRILIAPSLRWVDAPRPFGGPLVVLHSADDDGIALDDVRGHLARCGWTADLRVVGDDHTMIDRPALDALADALKSLAGDPN